VILITIWWLQEFGKDIRKQASHRLDVERFNLRNLSELEDREQHQIKISNRFADLENLNCREGVNRAWKNIKENTKTSAKKSLGL
jgi:hypothetical protein